MKCMNKVFGILATCMILGVMLVSLQGCGTVTAERSKITPETTSSDTTETTSSDFTVPNWFTDYPSIINEYRNYIDVLIKDGIESDAGHNAFPAPTSDRTLSYDWGCMQAEVWRHIYNYKEYPNVYHTQSITDIRNAFGYAIKDINGDGCPELVLLFQDYTVFAIFSTVNGQPNLLDAYWPRNSCAIDAQGIIYTHGSGGAYATLNTSYKISSDGSKLILIQEFGVDGHIGTENKPNYYKIIDGHKTIITESEFEALQKKYPAFDSTTAQTITKNSGLKFIPLFNDENVAQSK